MLKKKTSKRQGLSSKSICPKKKIKQFKINLGHPDIEIYNPTKNLLDEDALGRAIWECLKNNDHVGVIEIIQAHLEAKRINVGTEGKGIRKSLKLNTKNPSLKGLTQFIHANFVSD